MDVLHSRLPRGVWERVPVTGTLREILLGPAAVNPGTLNLAGALRTAMATTGYATVKELQKAEVLITSTLC